MEYVGIKMINFLSYIPLLFVCCLFLSMKKYFVALWSEGDFSIRLQIIIVFLFGIFLGVSFFIMMQKR